MVYIGIQSFLRLIVIWESFWWIIIMNFGERSKIFKLETRLISYRVTFKNGMQTSSSQEAALQFSMIENPTPI